MSQFTSLLMGCAREYWIDVLTTLCDEFNRDQYKFKWNAAYEQTRKYEKTNSREVITKKHLTRLRSSGWIDKLLKSKNEKISTWKICPYAIELYKTNIKELDADGRRFDNDLIDVWDGLNYKI